MTVGNQPASEDGTGDADTGNEDVNQDKSPVPIERHSNKIRWYLSFETCTSDFRTSDVVLDVRRCGNEDSECVKSQPGRSITMPEQQTRRRGDALEDAILKAAWQELTRHGYQDLSMEGVAARAGTSKTVLYRRWRTRAELALATMRRHASAPPLRPDTGRLQDDVIAILQWLSERYRSYPDVVQGLMIELPGAERDVSQTSLLALETAVVAAASRGEIVTDGLLPRLLRLPIDLAQYEMFVTRQPLSDQQIDEIVGDVFLPLVSRSARPKK